MSVLTDQVEAQGEKIRDLEVCLEGHQVKLNAAEEMLQQVRVMWLATFRFLECSFIQVHVFKSLSGSSFQIWLLAFPSHLQVEQAA